MAQTKKKTGTKGSAKSPLKKADRWKGFPIGRLSLAAPVALALAAPPEESKLPAIETLGALADYATGDDAVGKLCAYPGIGGSRAEMILGKLQGVRDACEKIAGKSGKAVGSKAREDTTGDRQGVVRNGPKNKDGVARLEVKPGRVLSWPWPPFEARANPGDLVLEDDPLTDPTEETLSILREAGFTGAQRFDQRHKLWVAEPERQSESATPVASRLGARVFGALDYQGIDTSIAHAARTDLRRARDSASAEVRTSPAPAAIDAAPGDLEVPAVDDFSGLDEALEDARDLIPTEEISTPVEE